MDMQIFSEINWLAVFLGALAFFMLGALWYSKLLFVKKWMGYVGIDPESTSHKKGLAASMIGSFILIFLISLLIAVVRAKLDITGARSGLKLGLVTGLFGFAALSITYLYEQKPLGLHLINGGYTLVGNIVSAIIICSWA